MNKVRFIRAIEELGFTRVADSDRFELQFEYMTFSFLLHEDSVDLSLRIFGFISDTVSKEYSYFGDKLYIKYALDEAKSGIPLSIGDNNLHQQLDRAIQGLFY